MLPQGAIMCCITCFVIEAETRLDEKLRLQLLSHFSLYIHFKAPNPSNYILLTDLTAFVACTVFSSALTRLKKAPHLLLHRPFRQFVTKNYVTSASTSLSTYLLITGGLGVLAMVLSSSI